MSIKISLQSKPTRYETVYAALESLTDELKQKIADKKRIALKINFVNPDSLPSCTHPDSVNAVLDFFKTLTSQEITLVEAPFKGTIESAFEKLGYQNLIQKYNLKYVDLNKDKTKKVSFFYPGVYESKAIDLAETILQSDFIISLCPPKTHDTVIATLGLKNVAVGATIVDEIFMDDIKINAHCRKIYHLNTHEDNIFLAQVIEKVYPDLNIIDGWQGMQGDWPWQATPVDWKIAIAGLEPLVVDRFTSRLMGFDPDQIGYLYCLQQKKKIDEDNIEIIGEQNWQRFQKEFKPHKDYRKQLKWK